MKKLLIILFSFSLIILNFSISSANYDLNNLDWITNDKDSSWVIPISWCSYDFESNITVWTQIDNCLEWSHQISWNDVKLDWWFAKQIQSWVNNISLYLWIFAVWAIVFWALNMTLSAWEEEKIKKSKDIIKWWIIWFIWLISITAIITLIIKIMYSI